MNRNRHYALSVGLGPNRPGMVCRPLGRTVRAAACISVVMVLGWMPACFAEPQRTTEPQGIAEPVEISVFGLPDLTASTIDARVSKAFLEAFKAKYPHITISVPPGMRLGANWKMLALMRIAADMSPDVLLVMLEECSSYINQEFLLPLDPFVAELEPQEIARRVPAPILPVICRPGSPGGQKHFYAFPTHTAVRGLLYRRDVFRAAGLPDRAPRDWEELLQFARQITDPAQGRYGLFLGQGREFTALDWMSFLLSAGGESAVQDQAGRWSCTFDSPAAAQAAVFYAQLVKGTFYKDGRRIQGVAFLDGIGTAGPTARLKWEAGQIGMQQASIDFLNMANAIKNPDLIGIGPVPAGPTGQRGSELSCGLLGIYQGCTDPRKQLAAWQYIAFYSDPAGQKAMVDALVANGYGRFVNYHLLEQFGYQEYLRQVPESWKETFDIGVEHGTTPPYGENSDQLYGYITAALGEIINHSSVPELIDQGRLDEAQEVAQGILHQQVQKTDRDLMGKLPPGQIRMRRWVALAVAILIALVFAGVFRNIWRVFSINEERPTRGRRHFRKYYIAYLCLLPAIGSILLWRYYPLVRGAVMAFQDYRVTGHSRFVFLDNFAYVLWDIGFWYSMWVTIKYAFAFLAFGFAAPIFLAILLQEIPRGKVFYRTVYYLPAAISLVVVVFLWKSFFLSEGLLSQMLQLVGIHSSTDWLGKPHWALLCCVAPAIWVGVGPGCLIYLAALKTIPDDLYEAASIDGATVGQRIVHITLPSIKTLILINFVGAFIGAFKSADLMLAMTGGGPYTAYGGATEVVGLKIFYTAFGYLRFGIATAMAWILGLMLIGFTVIQLRKLRNLEFRAAGPTK